MKTIRKNSKQGQYYVRMYERAEAQNVREFYKKPSDRKIEACNECRQQCQAEQGLRYRIISGSSHYFTAAWRTSEGLRVKTAYNSFIIK